MEDIIIEKTSKTPAINFEFENKRLEIKGVSIPEDADTFYTPLLEWVKEYVENQQEKSTTVIMLKLIYFNTSTSDYLVTILKTLRQGLSEEKAEREKAENEEETQTEREKAENEEETRTEREIIENEEETPKDSSLIIEWYYEEEDEDMRETGTHFESIIDLPFVFQPCEEIE